MAYVKRTKSNYRRLDLTGRRFGKLLAESAAGSDQHGNIVWLCRCDCGKTTAVITASLMRQKTQSCGCLKLARRGVVKDLVGQRFGRLEVIAFSHQSPSLPRIAFWHCHCDCGSVGVFSGPEMTRGDTRSCGCLRRETLSGENNPKWNGGRKSNNGYVMIRTNNGYILEHRLVMEQHIGRALRGYEVVHHKNGNKQDNRIENLELMTRADHMGLHATIDAWSIHFPCCVSCGTTAIRHYARGRCYNCYEQLRPKRTRRSASN